MRTSILRVLVGMIAIVLLLLTNTAVAQDETELPQTQTECEAAGHVWFPEGAWGFPGRPAECVSLDVTAPAPVESAPTGSGSPARLPASQPTTAQSGTPHYTG